MNTDLKPEDIVAQIKLLIATANRLNLSIRIDLYLDDIGYCRGISENGLTYRESVFQFKFIEYSDSKFTVEILRSVYLHLIDQLETEISNILKKEDEAAYKARVSYRLVKEMSVTDVQVKYGVAD